MYRIYARQAIELGLQDSEANRTLDVPEVRARFGGTLDKYSDIRIIAHDSKNYADHLIDKLTKRAEQIATFPLSGRMVSEYRNESIREVIQRPYRIIYRIKGDQIS